MSRWKELTHVGRRMTLTMRTTASPEQVYAAWADPGRISHWFVDRAHGEAKPGGTVTWIFEEFGYEIPYEVKDAVPGERFCLGGQLPGRPPFLLEVTLRRDGGHTLVTVVNSGFLETEGWDDEYEGILSGWAMSLALLKHYLENHDGLARRSFLATRPARFEYEKLRPYFATAGGLESWLAEQAVLGAVGEPCMLRLRDGGTLTGRVLAVSRWEVALSWSETGGVLEMKAFKRPDGSKVVGLRGTFWGLPATEVDRLKARMQAPLERLAALIEAPARPGLEEKDATRRD